MDISLFHYLLVGLTTFLTETFFAFGGSSFLIQPVMLAVGVPSHLVVPNDVASTPFSGLFFAGYFLRKQKFDFRIARWMALPMIVGAFLGGIVFSHIPEAIENWVIIAVCGAGLFYVLLHRDAELETITATRPLFKYWQLCAVLVGFALGLYDGLSGAGGYTLIIMALTVIFRTGLKDALVIAAILSLFSTTAAGLSFWRQGLLDAGLMLAMIPACCLAGIVEAKIVYTLPEKILRLIFACVIAVLIAYLIYQQV